MTNQEWKNYPHVAAALELREELLAHPGGVMHEWARAGSFWTPPPQPDADDIERGELYDRLQRAFEAAYEAEEITFRDIRALGYRKNALNLTNDL